MKRNIFVEYRTVIRGLNASDMECIIKKPMSIDVNCPTCKQYAY